jgi:hypothetical protein
MTLHLKITINRVDPEGLRSKQFLIKLQCRSLKSGC